MPCKAISMTFLGGDELGGHKVSGVVEDHGGVLVSCFFGVRKVRCCDDSVAVSTRGKMR